MPGPPAKHPDARRRRNLKETAAELEAPAAPEGPELPESYIVGASEHGPVSRAYSDTTRRWWAKLRKSPHASAYQDVHWEWLLLLAPLFDRWAALGDIDAFKELRLQAPSFGLRPADANKLDWTIDPTITGPGRTATASGDAEADEPPRGGKGSGTAAWRRYAVDQLGIHVDTGASRDDIIEAVDRHKNGRPARQDPRLTVYDGSAAAAG